MLLITALCFSEYMEWLHLGMYVIQAHIGGEEQPTKTRLKACVAFKSFVKEISFTVDLSADQGRGALEMERVVSGGGVDHDVSAWWLVTASSSHNTVNDQ